MRTPASSPHDAPACASAGSANQAREEYLSKLSGLLGDDRTKMIASAWSGGTVPAWLQERMDEPPARPMVKRRNGLSFIRQTTMGCVTAALSSCLFLYWGKSQAAMADREIGKVVHATQEAHARVYALRTEWALLNQPERLQDMANHYLKLQPVAPAQFAEAGKLGDRLQAPVAAPPDGSAEADAALASAEAMQPPAQGASAVVAAVEPGGAAAEQAPAIIASRAEDVAAVIPQAEPDAADQAVQPAAVVKSSIQNAARADAPAEPALRSLRPHVLIKAVSEPKYLTPMIAEARQPIRVRDSGEVLLNGEPESAHLHTHILRAAAYAALPPLIRAEPGRALRHLPAAKIDLPHWLMEAHLARPGRSEPPHALGTAIPLAAPQPEAAPVQRVIARPAPEAEHMTTPQAQPAEEQREAYEPRPYRPAYRQNYAYGNPYRPYYGQPYGGGGNYGSPYGGGYGNSYYRSYAPPPPPAAYYQ